MEYHDCYFGFYSQKFGDYHNYVENRFIELEQLIRDEIRWVKSDPTRYACITIQNKLVFAAYWDEFGFNQRRFDNASNRT